MSEQIDADCGPNPVVWTGADRVRLDIALNAAFGIHSSAAILQGVIDDFGNLIRACDLPHDVYMQRYNYFKESA